ncbi:DUF397 domain-containing protein [Streptomyces sp. ME19-01-6]|nr:DUF397 domain-containing protein [Streptomyces sp. ME19-01-6]
MNWQKSSYCGEGNSCVNIARVPADWRKSSHSAEAANCLNIAAPTPDAIKIRESDDPDVTLTATPATLGVFIRAAKEGGFDHLTDSQSCH